MDNRRIEKALAEQRKSIEKILSQSCLTRYITKKINNDLPSLLIHGVRGSGKTFTTIHALNVKGIKYAYVDLSDTALYALNTEGYEALLESLYMTYVHFDCVVVDEYLSHEKWKECFKVFMDNGLKIIAISSLSVPEQENKTPHLAFYPLSFSEYCLWHQVTVDSSTPEGRATIRRAFDDFLIRGGFPEMQNKKRLKPVASRLIESIVSQDIKGSINKNKSQEIELIANSLLNDTTEWINYKSLATAFNMRSEITLKKYIELVKNSNLLYGLRRFAMEKRQRNVYEKLYAVDAALCPSLSLQKKLETIVYMQLRRFCERHGYNVHYYSNRNVDCNFALCQNKKMRTILQVMSDYTDSQIIKEKISGLINMSKLTGCDRLYILTDNQHDTIEERGLSIIVIPVYEFLTDHSHKIVSQ